MGHIVSDDIIEGDQNGRVAGAMARLRGLSEAA